MHSIATHNSKKNVVVVGGGITGLSAAYHLQKALAGSDQAAKVTLLEASDRLGGKLTSEQDQGFLLDGGPDCFLTRKPWALEVCREIGLEDELLKTNKRTHRVQVLSRGRLQPLPEGVMLIVPTRFLPFALSPLISLPGKLRMALDLVIPKRAEEGDETLGSFVRRRLGREALDKIAEPLLSGIHVSDPDHLSLESAFPRLLQIERKYGSLTRGMLAAQRQRAAAPKPKEPPLPMFMSLKGGMQQIADGLAGQLATPHVDVRLKSPVDAIASLNGGGPPYAVQLQNGDRLHADAVVLTTPSSVSSQLVKGLDAQLAEQLAAIRYVSTAVIALGYRNGPDVPQLQGFGFLIPKSEGRRITACTFSSTKFEGRAPEGYQLLRAFMGGPGREEILELDDEELVDVARDEIEKIVGVRAKPALSRVFRWPKLNPQYDLNHLDRVADMRNRAAALGGLRLAGCAYDGVGVPDCIRQGKEAAQQTIADLAKSIH